MTFGTVEKLRVIDVLGSVKRELQKAIFLSWEIDDYFAELTVNAENDRHDRVLLMAEHDAYIAEAKAEIIDDILDKMLELINNFQGEIEGGKRNDDG